MVRGARHRRRAHLDSRSQASCREETACAPGSRRLARRVKEILSSIQCGAGRPRARNDRLGSLMEMSREETVTGSVAAGVVFGCAVRCAMVGLSPLLHNRPMRFVMGPIVGALLSALPPGDA